jgi:YD repeat-containing protein
MLLLIAPSHLQFRPTIERFSGKLKDLLSNFIQILVILSIVGTSIGVSNSAAVAANLSQDDVKDQPELSTQTAIGSPRDQSSIQSNELSIHSKDSEQALSTTQSEENESRIWAGTTNAGIWVYENNAWSHRSNGIESSSVNNLAVNPNNRDNLLAVVGRNVYRTNDAGMSWHKVSMPITQDGWNRIFWDRATPGEVVISGPDLGEVWDAKPVAAISHDAGVSWRGIPLGTREGELGQGFPGDVWGLDGVWYIIGNSALNLYFVPCTMHAMWRSFNHGGFWELTCEWPRGRWQTERFITGRWTDPAHLYGAYTHSYANLLVESGNAGDNWAAGDQAFHSARQFLSDPVREGDLWLVAHNHLYHSSTGISGFSRADTLDTNAWAVAVDGYQGTVYTAGDYRRVAYSLDLGDSWTRIDLPRVDPVTDNTHVRFLAAELPPIISLPDRSDLSDCETKDQQGDPRECQVNGAGNTQGYAGDPINTQTGGFHTISNDLSFNTAAGPLTFQRTYSSRAIDLYTETLGYGWTHNHDTHLIFPDDPGGEEGILWFKAHTANQYRFTIIGDGEYKPYPGVLGTLHLEDGPPVRYILTDRAQQTYTFDEDGKLLTWTNAVGNGFHYQYDGEGRGCVALLPRREKGSRLT